MWILEFVSETFVHLMVLLSIAGLFVLPLLFAIPFFNTYKTAAQYILIAVLALGVFTEGTIYNNRIWEGKQQAQVLKDTQTELKQAEVVVKNVEVVVEKIKIVKEKQDALIIKVPVYVPQKVDNECIIPNSVVQLFDYSTQNQVPGSADDIQPGNSDVKMSEMQATTIENNGKYYELKERYEGLRRFYLEQKKISDDNQ